MSSPTDRYTEQFTPWKPGKMVLPEAECAAITKMYAHKRTTLEQQYHLLGIATVQSMRRSNSAIYKMMSKRPPPPPHFNCRSSYD